MPLKLRSLWEEISDSESDHDTQAKEETIQPKKETEEDNVPSTLSSYQLMSSTTQYKRALVQFETTYRKDLAVHLYSLFLLHQVKPELPNKMWSAWPLPERLAPVPRAYTPGMGCVDEPEEINIGGNETVRTIRGKGDDERKEAKQQKKKERKQENKALVVKKENSQQKLPEAQLIPQPSPTKSVPTIPSSPLKKEIRRKETFSSDEDESEVSFFATQLRSNRKRKHEDIETGEPKSHPNIEDTQTQSVKRKTLSDADIQMVEPAALEPTVAGTEKPYAITRNIQGIKFENRPNGIDPLRRQIDILFKRQIAKRFARTKSAYPEAQPSTEIKTPEILYEKVFRRLEGIVKTWAPSSMRAVEYGFRTWKDVALRNQIVSDDEESNLKLRAKFDRLFKDIPTDTLRKYLRKLREMEANPDDSQEEDDYDDVDDDDDDDEEEETTDGEAKERGPDTEKDRTPKPKENSEKREAYDMTSLRFKNLRSDIIEMLLDDQDDDHDEDQSKNCFPTGDQSIYIALKTHMPKKDDKFSRIERK